ncbi:MAG: HD-GYP domain-containing protein [Pirellulales bacterium]|nr:HD-GYP domain-containing protein [Pirellulales bacterium]
MSLVECENPDVLSGSPIRLDSECERLLARGFGVQFSLYDGETGAPVSLSPQQPKGEGLNWSELCRVVSRSQEPEFLGEEDPLIVLALPIVDAEGRAWVAVGTFLTRAVGPEEDLSAAAGRLGLDPATVPDWAAGQTPWTAEMLLRVGRLVLDQLQLCGQVVKWEHEAGRLSIHLAATYEEISLLHRLTQNLKISQSDEELGRGALEWLDEVIPARGFALQLLPVPDAPRSLTHTARTTPLFMTRGDCPVDEKRFTALMAYFSEEKVIDACYRNSPEGAVRPRCRSTFPHQPLVLNLPTTIRTDWPLPEIEQLMVVSLAEGENLFGYLTAFNHVDGGEFGTVEASLMNSVAAILGIHSGNIELYRQQSELLDGIVRALTSAIDAKDPYTCGHSDRVARVAVRLAQELGCDPQMFHTIYLAGLLHDVGKIGVEDSVLRKPGKLSSEEYERIKSHVQIGHHILHDLSKFENVLPVVLYHHEAWDGGGYPLQLNSQAIPLAARIVAVADAFDAMSSDRPYRSGLPQEKIADILRAGAGKQWDPDVVAAFFRAYDDILQIVQNGSGSGFWEWKTRNPPSSSSPSPRP